MKYFIFRKILFISLIVTFSGCTNIASLKKPNELVSVQIDFIITSGTSCVELKFDDKIYYWGSVGEIPMMSSPNASIFTAVPQSASNISITIYDRNCRNGRTETKKINLKSNNDHVFIIQDWTEYIKIEYYKSHPGYL
jgi:hypothetical protein